MNLATLAAKAAAQASTPRRVPSPVSIKSADVMEDGTFVGYGSVFNFIDSARDVTAPGAFAASIKAKMPKLLWQHDTTQLVGVWTEAKEDSHGLWLKGKVLTETQKGREALALMRAGALDGLSIGFETIEQEWGSAADYETKYGCAPMGSYGGPHDQIRILKAIDLWEVSLVTFPCCEPARVDAVKRAAERHAVADIGLLKALERRGRVVERLAALA